MTASQLLDAIHRNIKRVQTRSSPNERARSFVAGLSATLEETDQALADALFSILKEGPMAPVFCRDCEHSDSKYSCGAPETQIVNLVRGSSVEPKCDDARKHDGACGPGGIHFTPIAPRDISDPYSKLRRAARLGNQETVESENTDPIASGSAVSVTQK